MSVKRLIRMNLHAVLEYVGAAALVVAPLAFGWPKPAAAIGMLAGLAGLVVSLLTDYGLSIAKLIPIEVHSVADYVVGGFLVVSPIVGDYLSTGPGQFHVSLGVAVVAMSALTDYRPAARARTDAATGRGGRDRRFRSTPIETARRRAIGSRASGRAGDRPRKEESR